MEQRIAQACQDIAFSAEAVLRHERVRRATGQQAAVLRRAAVPPPTLAPFALAATRPEPQPDPTNTKPVGEVRAARQALDERIDALKTAEGETGARSRGLLLQLKGLLGQLEARLRGRRDNA